VRQFLEYYYLCYKRVCVTHLLHIISDVYVHGDFNLDSKTNVFVH